MSGLVYDKYSYEFVKQWCKDNSYKIDLIDGLKEIFQAKLGEGLNFGKGFEIDVQNIELGGRNIPSHRIKFFIGGGAARDTPAGIFDLSVTSERVNVSSSLYNIRQRSYMSDEYIEQLKLSIIAFKKLLMDDKELNEQITSLARIFLIGQLERELKYV